ncbi:MAG TPA: hypothetical protein VL985_06235 [Stellaceae bacterium]|nr:hypothetical protein [Stellaceae bacterium]
MPVVFLLRVGLWALCVILGSLGVFFSIISFTGPAASSNGVILLGAALGINYFLDHA